MGERVVVDPAVAAAAGERSAPRRAVPLGYGHADGASEALRRNTAAFREAVDRAARRLGGWRRIAFALGVAFIPAGFAYGLANPWHADESAFLAGLGGLLVGFTAPLKGLDATGRRDETL
jgi:hypothetical protein